jgi:transcriptional regulator with XRE-family HTH domain
MGLKDSAGRSLTLIELMRRSGKTQDGIAESVGVTPSTLRKYSKGERRPTIDPFFALCRELSVSPKKLGEALGIDMQGVPDDE